MVSMFDLSSRQRDILYQVAALNKPSGPDVHSMLVETTRWMMDKTTLDDTLRTLEEMGYVTSATIDGRDKEYWLSDEGRMALEEYHEWTADCIASAWFTE